MSFSPLVLGLVSSPRWRIAGYAVLLIAAVAAALWWDAHLGAEKRWEETKAALAKEGESTDWWSLLSDPPPDEVNFCAIEELRGITQIINGDRDLGEPGAKRKALDEMRIPFDSKVRSEIPSAGAGLERGLFVSVEAWSKHLEAVKFFTLPAGSEHSPAALLTALDRKFPLLAKLAARAPHFKQAVFLPSRKQLGAMPGFDTNLIPHMNSVMHLVKMLYVRAKAAIEAGNAKEGANSALAMMRLINALSAETSMLPLLVAVTCSCQVQGVVWDALHGHHLGEPELAMLQMELEAQDMTQTLLNALRGELTTCVASLDQCLTSDSAWESLRNLFVDGPEWLSQLRMTPRLLTEWKADFSSVFFHQAIKPLKATGLKGCIEAQAKFVKSLPSIDRPILDDAHLFTRLAMPAYSTIIRQTLFIETRNRLAVAALAAERYSLAHGGLPKSLEELKPGFLKTLPVDPMSGGALLYRLGTPGRVVIWSVGFDGKDDGGVVPFVPDPTRPFRTPTYDREDYLGDWVWQYEPLFGSK